MMDVSKYRGRIGALVVGFALTACSTPTPKCEPKPETSDATKLKIRSYEETVFSRGDHPRPRAVWARTAHEDLVLANEDWTVVSKRLSTAGDPWVIRALRTDDGELVWQREVPGMYGDSNSHGTQAGDIFIIYSQYGAVGLRVDDGTIAWKHRFHTYTLRTTLVGTTVAACFLHDKRIELISADGKISSLDLPCSGLSSTDDALFAGDIGHAVYRVDPASAKIGWQTELHSLEIHALGDLVLARVPKGWVALSAKDGSVAWTKEAPFPGRRPTVGKETSVWRVGDHVVASTHRGTWAYRLKDGHLAWSSKELPSNPEVAALHNGHLLVFTKEHRTAAGSLIALDASSGKPTAQYSLFNLPARLETLSKTLVAQLSAGVARIDLDEARAPLGLESNVEYVQAIIDDPLVSNQALHTLLKDEAYSAKRRSYISGALEDLPARRIPSMLDFVVSDRIYEVVPHLAVRCADLKDGGSVERHFLRIVAELEDARLAPCFQKRLDNPKHDRLARQALARMATSSTDAILAKHLESLERPYAWDPCTGSLEKLCEDDTDADADGVPDAVEVHLLLDPKNNDTDADGLDDRSDPCPLLASASGADDAKRRIETALLTYLGADKMAPVMVRINHEDARRLSTPPICPDGLRAPVLHVDAFPPRRSRWVLKGGFHTTVFQRSGQAETADEADELYTPAEGHRASVEFWLGSQGHRAMLVFRAGRWFVESIEGTWVA